MQKKTNHEKHAIEAYNFSKMIQIITWIAAQFWHYERLATIVILACDILGALCLAGAISGIVSITGILPYDFISNNVILGDLFSTLSNKQFAVFFSLLGLIGGSLIYSGHLASTKVAARLYKRTYQEIFATLGNSLHTGWQINFLGNISPTINQVTRVSSKLSYLAVLQTLKILVPAIVAILSLLLLFYLTPLMALIILPFTGLYLFMVIQINKETMKVNIKHRKANKSFRSALKKILKEISKPLTQQRRLANDFLDQANFSEMIHLFKQRKTFAHKASYLNNALLFLSIIILAFYSMSTASLTSSEDYKALVSYFIVLIIALTALNKVFSAMIIVSRYTPGLTPLLTLLNYRRPVQGSTPMLQEQNVTELTLNIPATEANQENDLTLPKHSPIIIIQNEPVNRYTLPEACLILENNFDLPRFSMLDVSVFSDYLEEGSNKIKNALFAFHSFEFEHDDISSMAGSLLNDYLYHFYVSNNIEQLLQNSESILDDKTPCVLIKDGEIIGWQTLDVLRKNPLLLITLLKKGQRSDTIDDIEEEF